MICRFVISLQVSEELAASIFLVFQKKIEAVRASYLSVLNFHSTKLNIVKEQSSQTTRGKPQIAHGTSDFCKALYTLKILSYPI
jgi:hypothetical protein